MTLKDIMLAKAIAGNANDSDGNFDIILCNKLGFAKNAGGQLEYYTADELVEIGKKSKFVTGVLINAGNVYPVGTICFDDDGAEITINYIEAVDTSGRKVHIDHFFLSVYKGDEEDDIYSESKRYTCTVSSISESDI